MRTRRDWLTLAATGVAARLYAAQTDFWNKKVRADWTDEEIARLLNKSPWAKQTATIPVPGGRGSASADQGESGVGVNGIGLGRGGRQERQEGKVTAAPLTAQGVVIWESAQVILDARRKVLPKEFNNHYALSIGGIPLHEVRDEQLFDQLRQFTSLQPNDQPPVQPGTVQKMPGTGGAAVLVGFSKDVLELSADDKTIQFVTQVGRIVLKCKFDIKEMRYKGRVAL
jgi:hypothetical protein